MTATFLLILFFSLLFSAFFSGMEIAFVSANRLKIELNKKQNSASSKIISVFIDNQGQYISTMLVGNNIALVIYGIFFAKFAEEYIRMLIPSNDFVILLIQTILSTLLILVTAEFLPKTVFRQNANVLLQKLAFPVMIFYILFYPIAKISVNISNSIIRLVTKNKKSGRKHKVVLNKIDLDNFLTDNEDSIDDEEDTVVGEVKIFKNALDFSEIKIRECIVPRNEIIVENINTPILELKKKFIETGFSKIFIFKENIDNIVGYVHTLAIFKQTKTIKAAMSDLTVVPETMPANKLLNKLLKERKSVALVVDEFGGTSGIVTLEDIIEEIFGEIEDEHDANVFTEHQIKDNEFVFSARIEIDYLNDKYKFELPCSEEYETLAGYVFYLHEQIPEKNEIIETEKFIIEVLEVNKPKIEKIRLIVK